MILCYFIFTVIHFYSLSPSLSLYINSQFLISFHCIAVYSPSLQSKKRITKFYYLLQFQLQNDFAAALVWCLYVVNAVGSMDEQVYICSVVVEMQEFESTAFIQQNLFAFECGRKHFTRASSYFIWLHIHLVRATLLYATISHQ